MLTLLRWLRPFLKPNWLAFLTGVVIALVACLAELAYPLLSGGLVDLVMRPSAVHPTLKQIGFSGLILILGATTLVHVACIYISDSLFSRVGQKTVGRIRSRLYRHILQLPMGFHTAQESGALSSRVFGDTQQIQTVIAESTPKLIQQGTLFCLGIALLALTSWKLMLVIIASFPVIFVAAMFLSKQMRHAASKGQDDNAKVTGLMNEAFDHISTVKAFTNEAWEHQRYDQRYQPVLHSGLKAGRSQALAHSIVTAILMGGGLVVLGFGGSLLKSGDITPGALMRFVIVAAYVVSSGSMLAAAWSQFPKAQGASQKIRELLSEPAEIGPDAATRPEFSGRVEFRHVSFSYPSRAQQTVIAQLSFSASPGDIIALVGPSGSGKTTLFNLLMGYYRPNIGEILFDGRDARNLSPQQIREQISIVPQDPLLFSGTIEENIAYGRPGATPAEIRDAADQAFASDFIRSLPQGYQTAVGPHGTQLSGGQRQRIAIARAILKNSRILLLDEATSALDAESENIVQLAINRLMKGRTTFVIAHHLSTIVKASTILVFKDGRIVERGTHADLASRDGGFYAGYWRIQTAHETQAPEPLSA